MPVGVHHANLARDAVDGGMDEHGRGLHRVPSRQLAALRVHQDDVVRADLPGIPQDSISVQVENDVLTISGQRLDDRKEEREGYYLSERSYGSFQRSIALPPGVNPDSIGASFDNGVLEVRVQLPEQQKGRKVEIGKGMTMVPEGRTWDNDDLWPEREDGFTP